ncbi:hypothetical protein K0J45_03530 [Shewanella alkalitolerans]|uniref:hypothetical protein n=1 Tax=Shewanella alkalitolerans TaxID=2864209 RepID=UPI001C65C0D9|nr:hypothetical protein [Shewanella alkalitolerans]QYJ98326.1 hypothetical protein K0J45_03530 [Shewanella alkalitolerans]
MLDAVCRVEGQVEKTYSVFTFQRLSEQEIEALRQQLYCPVCDGKAYFRKASRDGKAACFGSRYHQMDCSEFNPSASRKQEEQDALEVNQQLLESDALKIDFSMPSRRKSQPAQQAQAEQAQAKQAQAKQEPVDGVQSPKGSYHVNAESKAETKTESGHSPKRETEPKIATQGLQKLLHSLLRGSDLASSDLWVYTDDKYRWRAKNLFVNFAEAEPNERHAPRMYWGTISHADKALLWLNPADCKDVGIPIEEVKDELCKKYDIQQREDLDGAGIILFGKCFWNKDKTRKIIQLWNKDLSRLHLVKAED